MKRVCVFCGSSKGVRAEYTLAAKAMGQALVKRNIGLVYGGGNVGLMGVIAVAKPSIRPASNPARIELQEWLMSGEVRAGRWCGATEPPFRSGTR